MTRALRGRGDEGRPLPPVYKALERLGARARQGQLVLVGAAPGGCKTAFVLNWVIKAGIPTAYFSADTDSSTLAKRAVASLTGQTVDQVSADFDNGNTDAVGRYMAALRENVGHISFDFNRAPDTRDVVASLESYQMLYADHPAVIVLDNLKDCWADDGGDGQDHVRYDRVIDAFRQIAEKTKACVIILHHVTGAYEENDAPIPMGAFLGKVSKNFRLCLTLRRDPQYLNVSVVKNSSGKADPSGTGVIAPIPLNIERMLFQEDYDPSSPLPPWHEVNLAGRT